MIEGVITFAYWSPSKRKVMFRLLEAVTIEGYYVPANYETDFATVPRLFFSVIPPIGKHNVAAILHDYLYDNRIGTRKAADRLFLKVMLAYGVPKWQAHLMYFGVRVGGKKWWNE
jgi:Protein of unknown function (DUF1353)